MNDYQNVGVAGKVRNCRRLNSAETSSTHFFKIMLKSIIQEKKLRIPKRFIQRFGDELSAVATLAVPNGCSHDVMLRKVGDEVYFKDGWHEFVKHHSICENYLLVFNYKGNSRFDVVIFDLTSTEVCYSCGDDDEDDSIEILESSTPQFLALSSTGNRGQTLSENSRRASLKKKEFKHEFRTRAKKLTINNLNDQSSPGNLKVKIDLDEFSEREPRIEPDEDLHLVENGRNVEIVDIRTSSSSSVMKSEMTQERLRAINAARMHKTKNPSFVAILQSYNIKFKHFINLPASFAMEFPVRATRWIKLRVSDGREWQVRCICSCKRGKATSISKGWSAFVLENDLKEGDICVFELIKVTDVVLQVTIFRVNDAGA